MLTINNYRLRQPGQAMFKSSITKILNTPSRSLLRNYTTNIKLTPPDDLNIAEKHIFEKLSSNLSPLMLHVQDISGGCGSMYAINIISDEFNGLSMIKQHRIVNEVLKEEIKGWHGLQLKTKAGNKV